MAKLNVGKIVMTGAAVAVGAGAGSMIDNKVLANMSNPKMRALILIAGGLALNAFVKNEIVGNVGLGVVATGALKLGQAMGMLNPAISDVGAEYSDAYSGIGQEASVANRNYYRAMGSINYLGDGMGAAYPMGSEVSDVYGPNVAAAYPMGSEVSDNGVSDSNPMNGPVVALDGLEA